MELCSMLGRGSFGRVYKGARRRPIFCMRTPVLDRLVHQSIRCILALSSAVHGKSKCFPGFSHGERSAALCVLAGQQS